jgi:ammonium transporter Rh
LNVQGESKSIELQSVVIHPEKENNINIIHDDDFDDEIDEIKLNPHIFEVLFFASKGKVKMVKKILDQNQDIHPICGDYDERTTLHLAASENKIRVVRFLINRLKERNEGLEQWLNKKDRFGHTPLDDAIKYGYTEISQFLRENGAKSSGTEHETSLINAAFSGNMDDMKRLLENKVNPNSKDYDNRTALHVAAGRQNVEAVELLLSYGADPKATDNWDGTPLNDAQRTASRVGENRVVSLLKHAMGLTHSHGSIWKDLTFWTYLAFQSAMIVLYALFCDYSKPDGDVVENSKRYPMFQDVHVMIFVGFGFLMTFLRKYGYSSVGLNMLISVIVLQLHPLLKQFWINVFTSAWNKIYFNVGTLINADFAAGTVLITFGALLGKTTPFQMMLMAMIEPIFYSLNEEIGMKLKISDIGGSMVIHCFGAFFGLAASWVMTPKAAKGPSDNAAVYHSDMFAMIGTLFLWMFWPSFNAAFADGDLQNRAVVNTLLALCASCFTAFITSYWLRGERKFCMVDIQNATLSGGVAMGTCANMMINPAVALAIGISSGFMSVFGYTKIQPRLERWIGLHDTCGVLNLHGIPSIMGAVYGAIASKYSGGNGGYQFSFLLITLGISIISGLLVGYFVSWTNPKERFFLDDLSWEVPESEKPYYFDKRGENTHHNDQSSDKEKCV